MTIVIKAAKEVWSDGAKKLWACKVEGVDDEVLYFSPSEPKGAVDGTIVDKVSKKDGKVRKYIEHEKKAGGAFQKRDYAAEERFKRPGFALSYAKDIIIALITAGKEVPHGLLFSTADSMLKWLNDNSPDAKKE